MTLENLLLVSDLDGTLLDDDHNISAKNKDAIKKFEDQGGRFTFATGRMEKSTTPYIEELEIELPVIVYNGAGIYDPKENQLTWKKELTDYQDILEELIAYTDQHDLSIQIYQDGQPYYVGSKAIIEMADLKERVTSLPIDQADLSQPTAKILMIASQVEVLHEIEAMVAEYGYPCATVYSEWNYFELAPLNTNKGEALLQLTDRYESKHGNQLTTVTAGNNQNDLPMLEASHYGFYVDNCDHRLRLDHLYPCVANSDHAIADIIDNFVFKKFL